MAGNRTPVMQRRKAGETAELARAFRAGLAADLISRSARDAYDVLTGLTRQAKALIEQNKPVSREHLVAATKVLAMAGLERAVETGAERDVTRMSLAELEAMISDLKVIDSAPVAPQPDSQGTDMFE